MRRLFSLLLIVCFFACEKAPEVEQPPKEDEKILWGSSARTMTGETKAAAYARVKARFCFHLISEIIL